MSDLRAYAGKILRVDLSRGRIVVDPLDRDLARRYIGGRGFNMKLLYDEITPGLDPLSPANPLSFGVGPLNGTLFPGAARFNVSAKSPQTGILGDSNAGGFFGPEMKFAGYDQIVIEGAAERPAYLLIRDHQVEIRPADHLWGLDVWQTHEQIRRELGDRRVQVACVGQAAENGVKFSGVFSNLVRAAARTGMGTVMAAKNLKAVAVRGTKPVTVADPKAFLTLIEELDQEIFSHPEYVPRTKLGTTRLLWGMNEFGCLNTRNYQTGRFSAAMEVSGERLAEELKRKSKACFACTIPCSRFFAIEDGPFAGLASEGPEFEGLAGFSSRVGNADLALTLKAVDMCNRYGMDVISVSACISFAMELFQRGIITRHEADGLDLSWGNGTTILALVDKIAHREGFGDVLADGTPAAARKIGRGSERYASHVKGMEFFQADPRGIKAYALGLAVASRGGDHLRSEPSFEFCENAEEGVRRYGAADSAFHLAYRGKGRVVKDFEEMCALSDCLNACKNTIVNMEVLPYDFAAKLLNAAVGWDVSPGEVQQACERIVNLERAIIAREGIRRADDTLPERFLREPLPPDSGPSAGQVVEIEAMLDEYYEARGWDLSTGLPTVEKLRSLGLSSVADDLVARGIVSA